MTKAFFYGMAWQSIVVGIGAFGAPTTGPTVFGSVLFFVEVLATIVFFNLARSRPSSKTDRSAVGAWILGWIIAGFGSGLVIVFLAPMIGLR